MTLPSATAGQAACLAATLLWAFSLRLFRGPIETYGARTINLAKCLVAATLQGATLAALGLLSPLWTAPASALVLISLSGLVGLTLGDTALFGAVARLGVHRALLLQTLGPVFAAAFAMLWTGETPTANQAVGALTVLAGVALVVAPGRSAVAASRAHAPRPASHVPGLLLGFVAAIGQGGGLVLAKAGMVDVAAPAASFLRLATAALGLVLLGLAAGRFERLRRLAAAPADLRRVVPAILLGTYVAIFLMMAGVALAPAAVAAVLLAMTPVFSLVLSRVLDGQRVTPRAIAGTLLAVAGVGVLVAGG